MKKFLSKRVLSFLLALTMLAGMIPMSALTATAAEAYGDVLQIDTFKGRVIDSKFALMIPYYWDSYGELPRGTNVESWFTGLPEDLTPIISEYTSGKKSDGSYAQYVHVRLDGIPETTGTYTLSIAMPEIFSFADPVTYQATLTIKELAPCSGCTFKTINEMQVCYKEGSGIHVCETNFGDEYNSVGSKYDKDPEDGYISAEEEPSLMVDDSSYWYFFDIEEFDAVRGGFFYLDRFPNLRTVKIESDGVVFLGENNTKLESIITDGADVKGLSEIPSSAPLQKIEIENATVDRYRYNFPMLEKLVLTDSVIDGELSDQIYITKDCAALKHIDLNGTDLSHNSSDTNISLDLANLEYLDVSNTGIKNVNIAHYSKLKYFYAKDNGLTEIIGARGEGGRTLADKCPELLEVDISDNYYISQFDIGEHQKIRKLNISNNDFVNLSLNNLPSLKELYAGYNDDLQALYLMNNPALEKLDLCCAGTEDFAIAMGDSGLPGLKYLDISYSDIVVDTNTAAFWAKMPSLETLDISYADSVYVNFSDSSLPNLKELIADGYYYDQFYVGALPKLEKIVSNESYAKTVSIYAPNLKELEITDSEVVTFNFGKLAKLKELVIENNKDLTGLDLEGFRALEWVEAYGCDSLVGIDFTGCLSIRGVRVSRDMNTVWPSGEGMPYEFDGWYTVKDNDDYTRNYHDGLKANREEPADNDLEMTLTYNIPNWKTGTDKWGKMTFGSEAIGGNKFNIEWPHKIIYNLSPYKETTVNQYTFYAAEVLSGDNKAIDMPGLVGWATEPFATELKIAYRPGEMIYNTGEDIKLWPVYNTETTVTYYESYAGDVWDEERIEELGLVKEDYYRIVDKCYRKSSLTDYWTYELLDLNPQREGYIFKGWKYDGEVYQPGDEIEFDDTVRPVIYAEWEKVVEMPSAYTYLSCDNAYFKKGDTVKLTAKVVGLNGANVSETQFNAFLYLYEEGKENEKTKVAERTFTGNEVDLTFTYPVDDTRIAYVEIFAYTDGYSSQKSITDDYKLTPAKAMDVAFKYSIGDGYVKVTEDTTIVLPKGANEGWLDIEVDAVGGKGDLNIRLYEINSNVTVGTNINNVVSTNTIGTKNYRASVSDETGNTVYTKQLTVKIVPELEVTDKSDDVEIANAQDVNFTIEYVGYNVTATLTYSDGSAVVGLTRRNNAGSERNGYAGTVGFSIPVPAPASGDTAEYAYKAVLVDEFGNSYYYEFHVYFDKTKGLTFAADGRGTLKFYNYSDKGEYANVFASGTDVVAELDGGWLYDITDVLYASDRNDHEDNVLIPTVGDGVEVSVKLLRYDSYEAYKAGGASVNVYEEELGGVDSYGYMVISEDYDESDEYIPGNIDLLWDEVMTPGYYVMTLDIKNASAVGQYDEGYCFDIKGTERWSATGDFEILADVSQHVHDYKIDLSTGNFDDETPHTHTYKCFCGDSYEENHVYPEEQADDIPWLNFKSGSYDTNVERRYCTLCGGGSYRWRFLESFTIDNADLQEGQTNAYEKVMEADQTLNIIAKLDFIEYVDTRVSQNTQDLYNGMASAFYPVNTKVNWKSSDQDVAKVDENGVVTAVGEGTALITATTVQPGKETGAPMTATILISVNCQHAKHMVKVPAKDPTCQADGHVEHYMCLDCTKYSFTADFTETVSYENDIKIPKAGHERLYGVWHADANGHWRECKYECGTKFDEDTHYSNESANCQHPEYCAVCDYVLAPITAHSHDTYGWSDGYHWSICECGVVVTGSNEVHQFGAYGSSDTCDDCGYKKNVGYTVSGTITSYLKGEGDITVQLLAADETVAYSTVVNTYSGSSAFTSTYSIPEVVDGAYTLRVAKANHVTRDYEVTVNGADFTQDVSIHLLGDVTMDGVVNIGDHQRLFEHLQGISILTDDYNKKLADTTNDTTINIGDHQRLFEHLQGIDSLFD